MERSAETTTGRWDAKRVLPRCFKAVRRARWLAYPNNTSAAFGPLEKENEMLNADATKSIAEQRRAALRSVADQHRLATTARNASPSVRRRSGIVRLVRAWLMRPAAPRTSARPVTNAGADIAVQPHLAK